MGCILCKKDQRGFKAMKNFESSLGFQKIHCQTWAEKFSNSQLPDNKLNLTAITSICNELSIRVTRHSKFLINFITANNEDLYDPQQLLLLGTILSSGTLSDKMKIIWESFGDPNIEVMSEDSLLKLVKDINEIFLIFVPGYVKTRLKMNKPLVNDCCFRMILAKSHLIKEYMDVFKGAQVDEKFFIDRLNTEKGKLLLVPNILRKYTLELEIKLENEENCIKELSNRVSKTFKADDTRKTESNKDKESKKTSKNSSTPQILKLKYSNKIENSKKGDKNEASFKKHQKNLSKLTDIQ